MKIAFVFTLLLATTLPSIVGAQTTSKLAPADEYFGNMKMSVLGINNVVLQGSATLHAQPEKEQDILHKADFAQNAFLAWATKYPKDTWLLRYAHNFVTLYKSCQSQESESHRKFIQGWINKNYPKSQYADRNQKGTETNVTIKNNSDISE